MGCALFAAAPGLAQARRTFDIPAASASDAIRTLARQSGLQVLAPVEDVRGVRTPALHGQYEPMEAVHRLVDGTGLEVVQTGPNTVTIRRGVAPAQAGGQTAAEASRAGDSTAVEEVIVTGSRIKRAGFDTLQAAFATDSKQIQERGYTNIIQALDETPGFAASGMNPVGTNQTTFGSGQAFADFFGLGSNRTLTLVNGRRFVTSNTPAGGNAANPGGAGLQVDLNVIPVGLVERVETVAIGGAPVYGSDAIAGTVNVILKDNFQGLQASAQYGVTGQGDGESQSYRLMVGGNFAEGRGNAVLGAEFAKQDGLQLSSRTGRLLALPNLDPNGPALDVTRDLVLGGMSEGGLPFRFAAPGYPLGGGASDWISDVNGQPLQFGPNGDLVPFTPGRDVYGLGIPIYNDGGDGVRFADHAGLLAPSERTLINGTAHYDITPRVRAFFEGAYAHSVGQEPSDLAAFAQPLLGGNQVAYHLDNAFLSDQARNTLIANGVTDTFYVARNFSDLLERDGYLEQTTVDLYRVVLGLQGDFDAWGETLNWDVSYNYGRSRALTEMNYINSDRLVLALDAVDDGNGNIVCRSGGSCVPINLFGEKNFSKAAADYVLDRGTAVSLNTQKVINANLSGRLPFGFSENIAFNVGAEHREERGGFSPDATLQAGSSLLGLDLASGYLPVPFSGYDTNEVYAEAVVPLVSPDQNVPFIKSLSFEGALRYVDNSRNGPATTWSAGGRFAPALPGWGDGLLFRGVFMHAIRSPAIAELNSPASPTRGSIADPCDAIRFDQGNNPSVRAANCAAELAALGYASPEDFHSTTTGLSPIGTVSGNPDLENEESDSWSLGFVYQPSLAPKFRFSMDWTNIKLEGGIESLAIGDMLTSCYDSPNFPNSDACAAFRRLTPSEVGPGSDNPTRVAGDIANGYNTGYINTASLEFAGLIVAAEYSFDLADVNPGWEDWGNLRLSAKAFYTDKYDVKAFEGQEVTHSVGQTGRPEWAAAFNVSYNRDKLDLNWNSLWTSSTKNDLNAGPDLLSPHWNNVDSYWKFNASIGYQLTPHLRAQMTVNNVFDTELSDAQLYSGAYTTYDLIGRTFLFNLTANF